MPRSRARAAARSQYSSFATEVPLTGALTCGEQLRFYALTIPALNASSRPPPARRRWRSNRFAGSRRHAGRPVVGRLVPATARGDPVVGFAFHTVSDELGRARTPARRWRSRWARGSWRTRLAVVVVVHQPATELLAFFDQVIAVRPGGAGCGASPQPSATRRRAPAAAARAGGEPADVLLGALQAAISSRRRPTSYPPSFRPRRRRWRSASTRGASGPRRSKQLASTARAARAKCLGISRRPCCWRWCS